MEEYKKGIYRTKRQLSESNINIIVFDGEKWWLPGWEIGLDVGGSNTSFEIHRDLIGELLWEETSSKYMEE